MKLLLKFIIVGLIFLMTVPVHSQNIRFERISLEDGLSQSVVTSILQDQKGFMWFGTQDGLNRYNGYNFKVYRHDPLDSNSISGNYIQFNGLFEDSAGNIWIATTGSGLNKFNPITETFTCFQADPADSNSLIDNFIGGAPVEDQNGMLWLIAASPSIAAVHQYNPLTNHFTRYFFDPPDTNFINGNPNIIFADSKGEVWVGTGGQGIPGSGLFRYDRSNDKFIRYQYDPDDSTSLSNNDINAIYEDHEGVLWIGTGGIGVFGNGLNRFNRETETFTRYTHDPQDSTSLSGNNFITIYEDQNNILWVGAWGGGLNKFDRETETFTHYRHDPNNPRSISNNNIINITGDSSGKLWVTTLIRVGVPNGIDYFDPKTGIFTRYKHNTSDLYSLGCDQIISFLEDHSGTIWLGTFGAGISKYSPSREKFDRLEHKPNDPNGLTVTSVNSVYEDRTGLVWIGTWGDGLNVYDPKTKKITAYQTDPNDSTAIGGGVVRAIYEDQDGIFWIGTNSGFSRFDPKTEIFHTYRFNPNDSTSISNNGIMSITGDRNGILWVGTQNGGLNRFNSQTGEFKRYQNDPVDSTSISTNFFLTDLHLDSDGILWVATGYGLNKFNPETEQFAHYIHDRDDSTTISSNTVQTIYQDPSGILWLGTWGGLNKFDPRTETFSYYTVKDGLPNDAVYGIVPDDHGHLWLSTNNGLSRFHIASETFRNYSVDDGLQSNEFNQCAYHRGRSGRLYFGGIGGLNLFFPKDIKDNSFRPPVVLTGFKVFEQSMQFDKAVCELEKINLSHQQNFFSFEFAALDYTNPRKNQYAYMLEGFDDNWRYCGSRRFVSYTNLEGGEYTFRVIGSNSDGIWNREGAMVHLKINPPFWKTAWFQTLQIFLLIAVILGIDRIQRMRFKQRMEFKRKTDELEYARKIQLSMLPKSGIDNERFEAVGKLITAAEVGGDYYDFIKLNFDRQCIVFGDATGHGVAAGLVVGMVKIALINTVSELSPGANIEKLMQDLNVALKQSIAQRTLGMCLGLAIFDMNNLSVEVSSAGMPFPYHFSKEKQKLVPVVLKGPPLGFFSTIQVQMQSFRVQPGDFLIFLSDGFEERFNPHDEMWGGEALEQKLQEICQEETHAEGVVNQLVKACDSFAQNRINDDDMTIVVLRVKE